jgi:PAS domain S-box-containing protein
MSDSLTSASMSRTNQMRAPAYIGPLISADLWPLRYLAAIAIVMLTVMLRAALAPLLGTQAPLLPFVLAVFVSAYLGGPGPGILASVVTPIAATIWFTAWPHDAPPLEWVAHVLFFLLIAMLATLLMHELQRSALAQVIAGRAAADSARHATDSAAQLRLIADAMPALISYIDTDLIYRFTNRLYDTWFGASEGPLVGRQVSEVLGPEAFELIRPRLERALNGERVFFESELPYASGTREVSVHCIPDYGVDGKARGCFALIEDVGPRKRAERSLREADRRKDEFLAILAHELRNPLTPIRNVAHILGKGKPDPVTVRRSGEMLERQATLLTHLVDDLLDVSHIIRGRISLRREPVGLAAVFETALESVRPLIEMRHQSVSVSRGSSDYFVEADHVRLCQVISNLLTNASKYSDEGANIDVTVEGKDSSALLYVRDQGIGIDPQMLPQVFDLFLQGDRTLDREHDGLGIGLTIVKHLVEMHGGHVRARSEGLGKGSEFRIELPRIPAPAVSPVEGPDSPHPAPRRRVLVVEDNRDSGESMRQLLRMHGHEVEVVNDGAMALARLEEFPADVVLMDIGLPRMDGYMVAHAIRARFEPSQRRPRLVALSGHAREVDRRAALRAGFDGHLSKPVEPAYLLRLIADERLCQVAPSEHG